jgi:hypothetical protein
VSLMQMEVHSSRPKSLNRLNGIRQSKMLKQLRAI